MKKIKLLVVVLLAVILLPFNINAAEKEPIKVHIFRGEGCGYCAAALEFFESIESDYGNYFDLEEHEVWYDEDNANLMTEVASYFGEEVNGVPYIIIGDKTFQGYAESYNEEIKIAIKDAYDSGEFVDRVMAIQDGTSSSSFKEEKKTNNKTTIIIIAVALVGFVALFFFAREPKEEIENIKPKKVEEEKQEEVKKAPAKKATPVKKANSTKASTAKKSTTSKSSTAKKTTTTKKTAAKKTINKTTKK